METTMFQLAFISKEVKENYGVRDSFVKIGKKLSIKNTYYRIQIKHLKSYYNFCKLLLVLL
jgi:flagellar biosynthesis component FlhA